MKRIFKAVICGQLRLLYYITVDDNGKKNYFLVNTHESEKVGGREITVQEYNNAVEEHSHLIYVKKNNSKYFSLMIQGLYIPYDSMFALFLSQCELASLFEKIISLNENDNFDHHDLLVIEKKLASNPGLAIALLDKILLWQEDHVFKNHDKILQICDQQGYEKIKNIFKHNLVMA